MNYKLGKKPARHAISFAFSTYFDRALLPTPPKGFGHSGVVRQWSMLANDQVGDCVFAGAAHETMMWCGIVGKHTTFSNASVLSDYSAVTGYDPADPNSDQGTDMQAAASYRRKTGVLDAHNIRHKVDAYVALRPGDTDQLAVATYLMNAVGVGIRFPSSAMAQFDAGKPWTPVKGDSIEGGHYVPCIGRNILGNFLVVTWGRLQAMTPQFVTEYMDEGVAYLSLENLKHNVSPEGFDLAKLRADLAVLNGGKS